MKKFSRMAEPSKILEGVFAISKPPSLSSAQVLRDLQNYFHKSQTFAPLLAATRRKEETDQQYQRKRRKFNDDNFFKLGHGGTLDPLATGVLIVGIGRGTKHLNDFLGCTKQYDTVVLFGKTTDTYDICGKIVGDAPFEHVTKDKTVAGLAQFQGNIKQVPPLYSALKINGMKAYEYARSGKELPRELESRPMTVSECSLVDYYEGGHHEFRWPVEEASEEDKAVARKLMRGEDVKAEPVLATVQSKLAEPQDHDVQASVQALEDYAGAQPSAVEQLTSDKIPGVTRSRLRQNTLSPKVKAALHTHELPELATSPSPAPAVRVRLSVSSGFYVRSFAHDLGIALGSYGIMAELIRSRQGTYTVASPAPAGLTTTLTYDDLEAGEATWGPKITSMLEKWMVNNPIQHSNPTTGDRNRPMRHQDYGDRNRNYSNRGARGGIQNRETWGKRKRQYDGEPQQRPERRNSSSPE